MAQIEKSVFISYRRTDVSWALAVYQYLVGKKYDVFFDYTSIQAGDFEQIIVSNIKARAHFVLILTPAALDRCSEPGDWLRREVETAIDEKRNIIPVFFNGFSFGTAYEKMTGKLENLSRYNGLNVHQDYFQEAMERLGNQFLNVPLDAVLHPLSTKAQKVVKEEQLAADAVLKGPKEKAIIEQQLADETRKPIPVAAPPSKFTLSNGMEFMRVPAGPFVMGSEANNKLASEDEKHQHHVDIPYDYWMARFPVTNELYNTYVEAEGIKHPVDGWEKKKDHPVTDVQWTGAIKYCQWLHSLLKNELPSGWALRLPTEAEWEKAARGTDGSEYPWGDAFDKNNCNTPEGGKDSTTPVGWYSPRGDSPYSCADMAGNVWEWTHSLMKGYPYDASDGREDGKASGSRVLRGGSFANFNSARCASRFDLGLYADVILNLIGFRVVASRA